MLVIRPEQLKAFEREKERAFLRDLRAALVERDPALAKALDASALDALVAEAVAAARSLGIETRDQIVEFAGLFFRFGNGFHEHPRVARVLRDESIPASARVTALFDRLSEDDWRAVALGEGRAG